LKKRLCVFVSGTGSNFTALLDKKRALNAEFVLVITDNPSAGALMTAMHHGIQARVVKDPADILPLVQKAAPDLIILAGYIKKIPDDLILAYENRIVNIHPALLPSFGGKGYYGLAVHQAVLDSGACVTGATVHFVIPEYDAGPIIMQTPVPVMPGDDKHSLQRRVLKEEHRIYWQAIRLVLSGKFVIRGKRVIPVK
jgi:phosphoribosylglycinamide formyltransferase 1